MKIIIKRKHQLNQLNISLMIKRKRWVTCRILYVDLFSLCGELREAQVRDFFATFISRWKMFDFDSSSFVSTSVVPSVLILVWEHSFFFFSVLIIPFFLYFFYFQTYSFFLFIYYISLYILLLFSFPYLFWSYVAWMFVTPELIDLDLVFLPMARIDKASTAVA